MENQVIKIDVSKLSNRNNPHYFILHANDFPLIHKGVKLIHFSPFKDASEANKYCKKLSKGHFYVFASNFEYEQLKKYSVIN